VFQVEFSQVLIAMEAVNHFSLFEDLKGGGDRHFLCWRLAKKADLAIGQPDRIFRSLEKGLIDRQDNLPVRIIHFDKEFLKPSVRRREEEEACGRVSVTAGAAALLIIGFY
jgi:hypothetical protein